MSPKADALRLRIGADSEVTAWQRHAVVPDHRQRRVAPTQNSSSVKSQSWASEPG